MKRTQLRDRTENARRLLPLPFSICRLAFGAFAIVASVLSAGCVSTPPPTGEILPHIASLRLTRATDPAVRIAAADEHACSDASLEELVSAFRIARAVAEGPQSVRAFDLSLARISLMLAGILEAEPDVTAVAAIGFDAARRAGAGDGNAVASYYAGSLLGLIMRGQGMKAVTRLSELERTLKAAMAEPGTDDGGPLRVLGMLYLRAPSWPVGIGDLDLALEHLERAASEFPGHPANHLYYAHALAEDDDKVAARGALDKVDSLVASGEWGEYGPRWKREATELREKLAER